MTQYVATFHTHLSALLTCRALTRTGVQASMAPVPRKLSSSCGTCVRFAAENPHLEEMDGDLESLYRTDGPDQYHLLHQNN